MSAMFGRVREIISDGVHGGASSTELAHAVITAMREPTSEMHAAAKLKRGDDKKHGRPTPWGDVYRAMIDAALR